jgi:hypothetical protein
MLKQLLLGQGSSIPAPGSAIPARGLAIPAPGSAIPGQGSAIPAPGSPILARGLAIPGQALATDQSIQGAPTADIPFGGKFCQRVVD